MTDQLNWSLVNFFRGDFIEVDLGTTDVEPRTDAVAGLLVLDRLLTGDGGMAVRVRSVGCSGPGLNKLLSRKFNRKDGYLHLCISTPCTEAEENYLHVTQFRAYSMEGFAPAYYMSSHRRQVGRWLERPDPGEEEERVSREGEGGLFGAGGPEVLEIPAAPRWYNREERVVEARWKRQSQGERAPRAPALRQRPAASARAKDKGQAEGSELKERASGLSGGRKKVAQEKGDGEELHLGSASERRYEYRGAEAQVGSGACTVRRSSTSLNWGKPDQRPRGRERGSRLGERGRFRLCGGFEEIGEGATLRRKKDQEDTKGSSLRDVSTQLIQRAQLLAGEKRIEGGSRGSQTSREEKSGERTDSRVIESSSWKEDRPDPRRRRSPEERRSEQIERWQEEEEKEGKREKRKRSED